MTAAATEGGSPARFELQRQHDAAEDRLTEASSRLTDAQEDYRDAADRVTELELALNDLAQLEDAARREARR